MDPTPEEPSSNPSVKGFVGTVRTYVRRIASLVFSPLDASWAVLLFSVVIYASVFSLYGIEKFADFRTGYFDFGQYVQIIWLTAHGDFTTFVIGRPILLGVAGIFLIFPSPDTLLVIQSLLLGIGAVPIYMIARLKLENRWTAVGFGVLYLIAPSLWGVNQYEFHDLALSIPFLLFSLYFYEVGRLRLYSITTIAALACNEFVVAIVLFFGLYLCALALLGNPKLTKWLAVTAIIVAVWAIFLDLSPLIPHFTLATINPNSYSLSGSSNFLNPLALLSDPASSLSYQWAAKSEYLVYIFAPLVFLPLLGLRKLVPAIPWLGVDLLYSPKFATGGVGMVYALYSQWSSFLIPFLFVASIEGFAKVKAATTSPRGQTLLLRRVLASMFAVTIFVSIASGGFSPLSPPTQFSVGDSSVPTDVSPGAVYHGVWPTPVQDAGVLNSFIGQIPMSDSILTQNEIGSKLGERFAPVYAFFQPGYSNVIVQAILVDYNLTGLCTTCLETILSSANYTLALSYPAGGIYLYYLATND